MITRGGFHPAWRAGCEGAPPPLHVVGATIPANWAPAPRPATAHAPLGPYLMPPGSMGRAPVGEDPTDPGTWRHTRLATAGMIARLNL